MLYHFQITTINYLFFTKSHNKNLITHLVLALHTHTTKLNFHTFEERRPTPFVSSQKSTLVQAYVTWAPTSHWLIPIGLVHHNLSLIFIYPSIFANTPPWDERVWPLCLLTKVNTYPNLCHMDSNNLLANSFRHTSSLSIIYSLSTLILAIRHQKPT